MTSRIGHPAPPLPAIRSGAKTPVLREPLARLAGQEQPAAPQFGAGFGRKAASALSVATLAALTTLGLASTASAEPPYDDRNNNGQDWEHATTPTTQPTSTPDDNNNGGLRSKLEDLQRKVQELETENDQLASRLSSEEGKSGEFSKTLGGYSDKFSEYDQKIGGYDQKISGLKETVGGFDERIAAQEAATKALQGDVAKLNESMKAAETSLAGLAGSLGGVKQEVNELSGKAGSRTEDLQKRLETIEATVNGAVQSGGVASKKDVDEIKAQQEKFSAIIQNLVKQGKISQEEAQHANNPLMDQVNKLNDSQSNLEKAIAALDKRLDEMGAPASAAPETTDPAPNNKPAFPMPNTRNDEGGGNGLGILLGGLGTVLGGLALINSARKNGKSAEPQNPGAAGNPPEPPPVAPAPTPVRRSAKKRVTEPGLTADDFVKPGSAASITAAPQPQAALPPGKTSRDPAEAETVVLPRIETGDTEPALESSGADIVKSAPPVQENPPATPPDDNDEELRVPPFLRAEDPELD